MENKWMTTPGLSERATAACTVLGTDARTVDTIATRRCRVLSSVLREPVLRKTFGRIAERYEPGLPSSLTSLAQRIDSMLLDPLMHRDAIVRSCREAAEWQFATVSVSSRFVSLAAKATEDTSVGVCASVAFPFGTASTESKIAEAQSAIWDGATEIDLVPPIGLLKAGFYQEVFADILYVRQAVEPPVKLRVVLESGLLTEDQIVDGALIAVAAGADAVSTSTGFLARGPSPADVRLLRRAVGGAIGIKVVGTIHTWEGARWFLAAGATRVASSRGPEIARGFHASSTLLGTRHHRRSVLQPRAQAVREVRCERTH